MKSKPDKVRQRKYLIIKFRGIQLENTAELDAEIGHRYSGGQQTYQNSNDLEGSR